jgi:hypothetical protein
MLIKMFAAAVAVTLTLSFLLPPVLKLKEISLGIVILIGIGMMLTDLWQSLKKREE